PQPKIDPIPSHKGTAPSSPAQAAELPRQPDVIANAINVNRKPKPIPATPGPPRLVFGLSRHKFRLFDDRDRRSQACVAFLGNCKRRGADISVCNNLSWCRETEFCDFGCLASVRWIIDRVSKAQLR